MFVKVIFDNQNGRNGYYCSLVESKRIDGKSPATLFYNSSDMSPPNGFPTCGRPSMTAIQRESNPGKGGNFREKQLEEERMARIEYTIKTTIDDGTVVEKTVSQECDLTHPDQIDRKTLKGLLTDIDKYEKAIISTRKEAEKELTEAVFASGNVKKNPKRSIDSEIGRFSVTLYDDFDTFLTPKECRPEEGAQDCRECEKGE